MSFKKAEQLVEYVGNKLPHTKNNNTEMVISCIEEIASRKGYNNIQYDDIWMLVKEILRIKGYNFQSLIRVRSDIFGTSPEQKEEEYKYWKNYSQ
jgi:hypothetical protein